MKFWDIAILFIVAVLIVLAVISIKKHRGCGGGCANCPKYKDCRHSKKEE